MRLKNWSGEVVVSFPPLPWRLTAGTQKVQVWFRSFSFPNGWFVGEPAVNLPGCSVGVLGCGMGLLIWNVDVEIPGEEVTRSFHASVVSVLSPRLIWMGWMGFVEMECQIGKVKISRAWQMGSTWKKWIHKMMTKMNEVRRTFLLWCKCLIMNVVCSPNKP